MQSRAFEIMLHEIDVHAAEEARGNFDGDDEEQRLADA